MRTVNTPTCFDHCGRIQWTFNIYSLLKCRIVMQNHVRLYNIYLNINQLDALNFIMSLFQASTCFEHMCSSSGGQNCTTQPLVSSH